MCEGFQPVEAVKLSLGSWLRFRALMVLCFVLFANVLLLEDITVQ